MVDKKRRFSYTDQKNRTHTKRWIVLWVFVFFVVYTTLTSLLFSVRVLENETMQPGLFKGDRFIFSSHQIYSFIPGTDAASLLRRGTIVLVDKSVGTPKSFFSIALDGAIRFFTAQRFGFDSGEDNLFIKRVIGLPGDEITMVNFVIRVKPKGETYSYTEFELWDRPYESIIPSIPALWDESLPFSGNMETVVLGENEYFVLSDDRSNSNDSRTWGPVPLNLIAGKVLFRYWPLNRLGIP
jgi:signal peptidase I